MGTIRSVTNEKEPKLLLEKKRMRKRRDIRMRRRLLVWEKRERGSGF